MLAALVDGLSCLKHSFKASMISLVLFKDGFESADGIGTQAHFVSFGVSDKKTSTIFIMVEPMSMPIIFCGCFLEDKKCILLS